MVELKIEDRDFLRAHADALGPVETALDATAGNVIDDWADRRRGAALDRDLDALGGWAAPYAPFSIPDTPAAAGALYVVEGSRLGGRFLMRQVGAGLPTAYLGDVQERGRWPALLAALDAALPDAPARRRAVDSARAVFARFEDAARRHLDPNLCEP